MKKLYTNYLNTFRGLSTEVWWLALMTFINRSGTMIIPFLSIYLREDLHISQSNVGLEIYIALDAQNGMKITPYHRYGSFTNQVK